MTYEEAKMQIQAIPEKIWDQLSEPDREAMEMAFSALEKQIPSAGSEQQWIPCSERLPDVAQRVLLSGHGTVMVGMLHSFGKYSLEPTGISYAYTKDDIDAWMPLPEPYRAERKVDEGSD